MYEKIWLQEMTWEEARDRLKKVDVAIIPIASTEQHGPALPLGTDTYVAIGLAGDVARKTGAVIAPPIWYGDSSHHMAFSGTITLRPETIIELIKDVCTSLIHHGFKKIVIINGHRGANLPALTIAAKAVKEKTGASIAVVDPFKISVDVVPRIRETEGVHAEEIEASHMLHLKPELVHLDRAVEELPKFPKYLILDPYKRGNRIDIMFTADDEARWTKSGAMGDPRKGTKEKGERYHQAMVDVIVDFIETLKEESG